MPEASEASFREHLERMTECAVCLDTADDPRRLPCGHSFCLNCLEELFKSGSSASRMRCPHCRNDHFIGYKGPSNLAKDFVIKELIDMLDSGTYSRSGPSSSPEKAGRCDFCPKAFAKTDIFFYCFDCDSICCADCRPEHRCNKGQTGILKKMDFQYSMICRKHDHPVRFICETCQNRLCKKCERQGTCDGHSMCDIFGGIMTNDQTPNVAKYTLKKSGSKRFRRSFREDKKEKEKKEQEKKEKEKKEKEKKEKDKKKENEVEEYKSQKSPARMSIGEVSVNSATFYSDIDEVPSPTQSLNASTIHEEPVVEIVDTIEQDANPQKWSKALDVKVRAVTMLPNGFIAVLTESSVLTFTNRGNEVPIKGSKVKLEDPQHIVYWPYRDSLVVTERMAKRLSLLKKDGSKCYQHVTVKPKRLGLFSCASKQSSEIKDFGPNKIAATPSGGFAVTTAATIKDTINPAYDVFVLNNKCKVEHRWQCELPPLSVTCDKDSLLYFPQWHTLLVYKLDGTKLYQFGDKKTLFQPLRVAPLSEEHHLLVAHRKSYIGDSYSVWRVSKWLSRGEDGTRNESKWKGYLAEFREGTDGPIVDITVVNNILVLAMEKKIEYLPITGLTLRRF